MTARPAPLNKQSGVMLLEALISILIFSMGILAIVGLQAAAISNVSDAKYRTDASLLANRLIAQIWASDRTQATLQASFTGINGIGGNGYSAWLNNDLQCQVVGQPALPASSVPALPGVCNVVANLPIVAVSAVTATATPSSVVTVTLFWQAPGAASGAAAHEYTTVAQIVQ